MSSLSAVAKVLSFFVKGEHNFCCLCFSIAQNIGIHEPIQINEINQNIVITEVLQLIFGTEIQDYLITIEKICEDCLKSIISIYSFIQTCHNNIMLLMKALDTLNDSFDYTVNENANSKSLFVSLNLEDLVSKHIYYDRKLHSTKAALRRFKILTLPKPKQVYMKNEESSQTMSKPEHTVNIKISDIMLDPLDQLIRKCKVCFRGYPTVWNLKSHYLRVHAPKKYKCPKCPKAYGSPSFAAYHLRQNHCEIVCSECGKIFKSRTTLARHERAHHLKLVCSNCGRTYKNKFTYKNHIELNICKQEPGPSPANAQFTCDYCGKKYTQKMTLRVHIQYDHGNYKSHVCEWCGKKFWARSRLKAHIVKHTREKNFTCTTCHGKFVSKESLLYHTRLHTGEKPYRCTECECTFISASRRAYHLKTNHLGATIECEICHSKFTSYSYLYKHKKCHKQPNYDENIGCLPIQQSSKSDFK